jgi:hypothetical protein
MVTTEDAQFDSRLQEANAPFGAALESAAGARRALDAAREASVRIYSTTGNYTYDYEEPLAALRDAQVASGEAVLAVAAELSATRTEATAELGRITHAVGELTRTIAAAADTAAESLPAGAGSLTDALADALAGVGGEIASLRDEVCAVCARRREALLERPAAVRWPAALYVAAAMVPAATVAVIDVTSVQIGVMGAYAALVVAVLIGGLLGKTIERLMRRWTR